MGVPGTLKRAGNRWESVLNGRKSGPKTVDRRIFGGVACHFGAELVGAAPGLRAALQKWEIIPFFLRFF
jgi:hypothetical protein